MIRLCRSSDLPALRQLAQTLTPPPTLTALRHAAWVMERHAALVGYAALAAAPGLPGVADLSGFIAPGWQRRGFGSKLLQFVCRQARQRGFTQLSCVVPAQDTPAALFLYRHRFHLEHEECCLTLTDLSGLPSLALPSHFALATFPLSAAATQFRQLYAACFGPHPWYQPYQDDEEVMEEMNHTRTGPADILFLLHDGQPIGFVWLRRLPAAVGEIEPIGILPAFQGQGLGRSLLLSALRHLHEQGAHAAQIAAWSQNLPALHLYQSVGFQKTAGLFYLTRDLRSGTSKMPGTSQVPGI